MRPFAIQRATHGDVDELVALWQRARWDSQPWLEDRMQRSHADDTRYFREILMTQTSVWLARSDRSSLGFIALANSHVEQLFVDPSEQGKGIGTTLLDHAKALFPAGLTLFTHRRNARARAFYERQAFRASEFGVSPAPESEPDVKYVWLPS